MNALSYILICGLLQVTVVATVGLLASGVCRRWLRSAAGTPLVAALTSVVLLSLLAVSPWPSWLEAKIDSARMPHASIEVASDRTSTSNPAPVAIAPIQPESFGILETLTAGWNGLHSANAGKASPASEIATETASSFRFSWLQITGWIFFAGVVCGLIRLIGGLWSVTVFVRSGRRITDSSLLNQIDLIRAELNCTRVVEIRESARLETAATVGWRHPVILISDSWTNWTPEQIRSVLAHEIAHITRGDFAACVAAQVGLVLHFYHPLMHWLVNSLRLEQELAADALAAKIVGGSRCYLHAIGELALKQSSEPLSWPAQAFLPTRRTFLRRIEMLRDLKLLSGPASGMLRASSIVAIAAVTLLVAGLRPPGNRSSSSEVAAQDLPGAASVFVPTAPQQSPTELEARYVPANAIMVAVARPAEIIAMYRKSLAGMTPPGAASSQEEMLDLFAQCNHLVAVVPDPGDVQTYRPPVQVQYGAVALTFANKEARDAAVKGLSGRGEYQKARILLAEFELNGLKARYMPDDQTLIIGNYLAVQHMIRTGPKSLSALTRTDAWHAAAKQSAAAAIDTKILRQLMAKSPPTLITGMFSPLWTSADHHTLGLQIGETGELTLTSVSVDEASASRVELTLNAGVAMLTNMIAPMKNSSDAGAENALSVALTPILDGHNWARNGKQVTLKVSGNIAALMGPLTAAMTSTRTAAQRQQQMNNTRMLLIALHNYHDVFGHFPSAVVIDPASNVPRSWRVEVLPYIDDHGLYEQYRKNEPWDSEANRKVLAQMPPQFRHPSQPADSTNTAIVAAYGKGLIFEELAKDGTRINEILDGTSNTVALVEVNASIPWTKPEDVLIDLSQDKLPQFGFEDAGFVAGFADGFVRFIPRSTDPNVLKPFFTRAGGETVDTDNLTPRAVRP